MSPKSPISNDSPAVGGLALLAATGLAFVFASFIACQPDPKSSGTAVLTTATASPAPVSTTATDDPNAPDEFRAFKSPDGTYALSVPAVWKEDTSSPTQTVFDGTTHSGAFSYGDSLLVTHLVTREPDGRTYDEGCGSHVCSATLTVVRKGTLQFKFRHEWSPDDPSAPAPGDAQIKLGKLADRVIKS